MKRILAALLLTVVALGAHAANFARPYTGAGPSDIPAAYGNTVIGMYLIDPVTGNPLTPTGAVSGGVAGISATGSVGTTSATIVTAAQFPHWLTIQNTSASAILYITFAATATTSAFAIAPGASLTIPTGVSNAIQGIGSTASTTFALVGY